MICQAMIWWTTKAIIEAFCLYRLMYCVPFLHVFYKLHTNFLLEFLLMYFLYHAIKKRKWNKALLAVDYFLFTWKVIVHPLFESTNGEKYMHWISVFFSSKYGAVAIAVYNQLVKSIRKFIKFTKLLSNLAKSMSAIGEKRIPITYIIHDLCSINQLCFEWNAINVQAVFVFWINSSIQKKINWQK